MGNLGFLKGTNKIPEVGNLLNIHLQLFLFRKTPEHVLDFNNNFSIFQNFPGAVLLQSSHREFLNKKVDMSGIQRNEHGKGTL